MGYPFSATQAMGCYSWSVPAGPTKTGGSCALGYNGRGTCKQCYALQGRYVQKNVIDAQLRRWEQWREGGAEWLLPYFNKLIKPGSHFRVFDSGDFSDVWDMDQWWNICEARPDVKFWIVTRSWRRAARPKTGDGVALAVQARLHDLQELPNVNVRISYDEWEEADAAAFALKTGVTRAVVGRGAKFACPKQRFPDGEKRYLTDASCEAAGCRACWDKSHALQTFEMHGQNKPVDVLAMARKRLGVEA